MAPMATAWIAILLLAVYVFAYLVNAAVDYHHIRAARVLDFAKEYRTSLMQTNITFSQNWNDYLNESVDPYNGGNVDEQAYGDLVTRFLALDDNRNKYEALAGFYEAVGECVESGLCDFWLARDTFGNDIVTFYHNMYPELETETQQGRNCSGIVDFTNRMHSADRGDIQPGWRDRVAAWAG